MNLTFNVLDRTTNVHRNLFLEASAGTGKTFSIENLILRLLIESEDCLLEHILVVTFTRAATYDLKQRIRAQIQRALATLDALLAGQPLTSIDVPDYLMAQIEKGEQVIQKTKRQLEQALFCYDEASIMTIHAFCMHALQRNPFEVGLGLCIQANDNRFNAQEMFQIIHDFFRTEITIHKYSATQLKIILKENQQELRKVENALSQILIKGLPIADVPHFDHYFNLFRKIMHDIQNLYHPKASEIIADFNTQLPRYKKPKSLHLSVDVQDKIEFFAMLFEKEPWETSDLDKLLADQLIFTEMLDPALLKARVSSEAELNLHYPGLAEKLRQELQPLIQQASDYGIILARMAKDCQKIIENKMIEEEKLGADDLLNKMLDAVKNPVFATKLRKNYQTVIVDEFQDTDPIQWKIFDHLFNTPEWLGKLYLVGDPKQSIYSFRQADIYTYLKVEKIIGKEGKAFLNVNYRSQKDLIKALNLLFSSNPHFISLPSLENSLVYQEVEYAPKITSKKIADSYGAVHFFIAKGLQGRSKAWPSQALEEEFFFPFIAQEILRLTQQEKDFVDEDPTTLSKDKFSLKQCVILVRDRFQADRLAQFFKEHQIPVISQRQTSLAESQALPAWIDLLQAVLQPTDSSTINRVLAGTLISWSDKQIKALHKDIELQKQLLVLFFHLQETLLKQGIPAFFDVLMHSMWNGETNNLTTHSLKEKLIIRKDGERYYQELQQIAELLMEYQRNTQASPEKLICFLKELHTMENTTQFCINRREDPTEDAVRIMTLHASKGLEFDIVFALGLASRTSMNDDILPLRHGDQTLLTPLAISSEKERELYYKELNAEKMRLLYVGLTRAKYRVYIPIAQDMDAKQIPVGNSSPIEIFLADLGKHLDCGWDAPLNQETVLTTFIKKHSLKDEKDPYITYSKLNDKGALFSNLQTKQLKHQKNLEAPKTVVIPGFSQFVHSFTSLTKNKTKEEFINNDTESVPQDKNALIKTPHTLPAGPETGTLLHNILEKIPFNVVKEALSGQKLVPFIMPLLKDHSLAEWKDVIAEMIFHTLRKPIVTSGKIPKEPFRLCDIDMKKCYRELEFLYPWDKETPLLEEITHEKDYLKGVIDLIFYHNGLYYIVDWKSNWLGPSDQDYCEEKIAVAMEKHHYQMQASIYIEALKRFLNVFETQPFEKCFGGIHYLFMRGIQDK